MLNNIRLASYLTKIKERKTMKPQKIVIFSLIVICVTLLLFTWITRVHSVNSILNEVIPNHYDYNI
ncbi:hypothetical protein C5468_05235 [Photorhabdus luminescens subsp. mexicana]|uniref:Uncharacterized protein n=1 Tax=Photorhabdus luminescens subsp. mexicana TaxID=2100167 RepID=A0A4V2X763_PHOLU|nr:hypothetical protein C5468_05235 [Photorhabdus luminescens subsp. mexicana]